MASKRERLILANGTILNMSRSSRTSLKNKCVISAIKSQLLTGFLRNINISIRTLGRRQAIRDQWHCPFFKYCWNSGISRLPTIDDYLECRLGDTNQAGLRYSSAWDPKRGFGIPALGTQQKELEPLRVPELPLLHPTDVQLQADLQAAIFLSETGLTLEEATGQEEAEIPVAPVLTPFQHGKPFVTEEEEKSLGTQMFNLHRWYLRMAKDEGKMFGVKYRDHDFFRGEDDFWVYFQNLYHIYHRQALDASIITI